MTTERPEVSLTGRYPIGIAAKKLGIDRHTLLARIHEGVVKCSYRKDNLRKIISGKEIIRFWESAM